MDLEKDDVRNFEAAAWCGNSRKLADIGLSRDVERPVASFVRGVCEVAGRRQKKPPPQPDIRERRFRLLQLAASMPAVTV